MVSPLGISTIDVPPKGGMGYEKIQKTKLNDNLMSLSTKFEPRLNKNLKTGQKTGIFDDVFQFWPFFVVYLILAQY